MALETYIEELYGNIYFPLVDAPDSSGIQKIIAMQRLEGNRPIDFNDPRNLLLNLNDAAYQNIKLFQPQLIGLSINKAFTTINGVTRVTFTNRFTYRDTRLNLLIDEPYFDQFL